jgi:hypothetical protein
MNNKEKYLALCEKETSIPIYSQYFWMDAVCGEDNWDVFLVESGGQIVAAMPYFKELRGSYKYITKAPLTQTNGIWFRPVSNIKYSTRLNYEEEIINQTADFIESLDLDVYEQQYHRSFKNWLPFFWRNYTAILRYTCVIEDTSDMQQVEANFSQTVRRNIKKAANIVEATDCGSPEMFYNLQKKTFERQNLKCPFSCEMFVKLYDVCVKRNKGSLLMAVDKKGDVHSGIFWVWDGMAVYSLIVCSDPEHRSSQSYSLLTYKGIQMASGQNKAYDFEGSVIQKIENFNRSFGAVQKPYLRIRKVFNRDIIISEAEEYASRISEIRKNKGGIVKRNSLC